MAGLSPLSGSRKTSAESGLFDRNLRYVIYYIYSAYTAGILAIFDAMEASFRLRPNEKSSLAQTEPQFGRKLSSSWTINIKVE